MVKKITNFEIRSFKLILKIKNIILILEKIPFILFFYYDFFNASERLLMRKFLNDNSLKTVLLKNEEVKQLNNICLNNKLSNLLLGNTLFIYNQDYNYISKDVIKTLINHPKLILIGGKWDNKIYRKTQIEKFIKLDQFTIQKSFIKELIQVSYILRNTISRLR